MMRATASSEAVSVSIRNVRGISGSTQDAVSDFGELSASSLKLLLLTGHRKDGVQTEGAPSLVCFRASF